MKGVLTDFVPPSVMIEGEDIPALFRRCIRQSHTATPHTLAREWIGRMNDVCNEDWGEDLKLSVDLTTIPTCDLVNELAKREGVQTFSVKSRQEEIIASRFVPVSQYGPAQPETIFFGIFGPVHILVVRD